MTGTAFDRDDSAHATDVLRVIVIGDWGTGTLQQHAVADAVESYCSRHVCSMVVSTGDNFYPDGLVDSTDIKFKSLFLDVYNRGSLMNISWYGVLGNHDHHLNQSADAQYVDLHQQYPHWNMVHNSIGVLNDTDGHPFVAFIFIDTTEIIQQLILTNTTTILDAILPTMSGLVGVVKHVILVAHHPIYSKYQRINSDHVAQLREVLEPFIHAVGVDIVLSGHEHSLEHAIKGPVHHVISGCGGMLAQDVHPLDPITTPLGPVAFYTNGFAVLELRTHSKISELSFVGSYGELLHKVKLI